jgi:hypothetical protein
MIVCVCTEREMKENFARGRHETKLAEVGTDRKTQHTMGGGGRVLCCLRV